MPAGTGGLGTKEPIFEPIMLDTLPWGIVVHDAGGTITEANSAALTILGLSRDQVGRGTSADQQWQAVHEDGSPFLIADHPAMVALKTGVPVIEQVMGVFNPATQHQTWITVTATPIWNPAKDSVQAVYSIFQDITRRRQLVAESTHNERIQAARLRLMTYAGNHTLKELLVATLDEAGELTGSPIGFYHFLEPDQKSLSLQAWSTLTTKEFCTAAGEGSHYNIDEAGVWVECIRLGKAVIHNDYASLPNKRGLPPGHAAVVREMVVPVFRNGLIVAILGVGNKFADYVDQDVESVSRLADLAWDFTESKRTEMALRSSEERFRLAMEATSDGVWDWNTNDDSGYFSPAYYSMLGYEPGEIPTTAHGWTRLVHPEDIAQLLACNQECIQNKRQNFEVEYRMQTKSGEWKWILGRGKVVARNARGQASRMVGTHVDITSRKETEIQINFLAYHDQLTGLPNRTLFFDRFSQAISSSKRNEKRVALLFLDLDGFKPINDQYGHDAGDIVLKVIADRLLASVRAMDTVARLGGDEFAIVLGQLESSSEASQVAAKLLLAVARPVAIGQGVEVSVKASIGISIYPDNGSEMDVLLGQADAAMYESKETGRDRYTFWSDAKNPLASDDSWIKVGGEHLIGFTAIDEQHLHLVSLVNEMNRAIKAGVASAEVERLFGNLIDYTKFHFATERKLMEQYRYPGKSQHDMAHGRLLVDVSHFQAMLNRGGDLFVLQSIKDWLFKHIQTEDKLLGDFLRAL